MWKWFKWVLLGLGTLIALFLILLFQPWVFLPHKHIEISLPFPPSADSYTGLIPMGEMIEHNASNGNENGHPGIDFGWEKETEILAVADGRITRITKNEYNIYIVEQQLGPYYRTMYQELNWIDPSLHFMSKVHKGQVIGKSGRPHNGTGRPKESDPSRQVHWDFASSSMAIDRLCPLGYFDAESRARIEAIWARVPDDTFKKMYPDICSGEYFNGRED
jgi:hypothetical protein